jgi:hypothetical protein
MELSNEEMLWELLAIHPWGQPMEYYFDIPRRTGGVKEHSRTGCYVGPDWDTPGSVMLLNFDTGRLVSAKKYVVLHEIPVKWTQQDLSNFVLNETPEPTIYEEDLTEPTQIQQEEMQTQSEETIPKEVLPEIPPISTEPETQPSDIISTNPNVLPTIIEEDEGKDEEGIVTDVPEPPVISESLPAAPEIAEPQNPPPVVTKSPQVRISKRGTSTWKDGPARLVKPLQGSQPAANSSEGATVNSADITRQEGGMINSTKGYDKKKSSVQRRYEKRELTRQVDRIMADYIPEVMVSCRGETLNLVVNLTKKFGRR